MNLRDPDKGPLPDKCALDERDAVTSRNASGKPPDKSNLKSPLASTGKASGHKFRDVRYFGWLTADISRLMRTEFDRRARPFGLTRTQWLALTRLHRAPGASQSELADLMEIEKAPAGRILDRLEERGWVERRPDPADRRINRMHLTVTGARMHADLLPVAEATVADALTALDINEQQQLVGLLDRVKTQLVVLVGASAVDMRATETRTGDADGAGAADGRPMDRDSEEAML